MRNYGIVAAIAAAALGLPGASHGEMDGVNVDASYTADVLRAVSGGISDGNAYLDNLDLTLELDAEALWGLQDVELFFYGLYNNGAHFSDRYVGDLQVVSNIETGEQAVRLYEAWVGIDLTEKTNLRFGLYDLNSEFDVLDSSALYLGSAHGIGTEISQTGTNGPSIFPNTSLALRVATQVSDDWGLLLAVMDGVPGDPVATNRTAIELRSEEGALLIAEMQRVRPNSKLLLGAWSYTAKMDGPSLPGSVPDRGRNSGAYLRGEALISEARGELTAFGRLGVAREDVNIFSSFYSGGLTWQSFSEARPADEMGIAFAWAEASGAVPFEAEDREVSVELTYRLQVSDRFAVQPNLQYVINPGLDPALDNAWVAGARFQFQIF